MARGTSISRVTSVTLVVATSSWKTIRLGPGWYWGPGAVTFKSHILAPEITLVLMLDNSGTLTIWLEAWLVSSLGRSATIPWEDSNSRTGIILTLEFESLAEKTPSKELVIRCMAHHKEVPGVGTG